MIMKPCAILIGILVLSGCAGQGQVVPLDVGATPSGHQEAVQSKDALKALIVPFEDQRSEKRRIGTRTHFWGGNTYFTVRDDKPGDVIAHALADYLKQKGWQTWVSAPGGPVVANPSGGLDVMVTGQIMDFSANAKSRFGSTRIVVKTKVALQAQHTLDGSISRMTLNGSRSETVFWFEPKDMEEAINQMLKESLDRLMADAKVENRLLQIK